MEVVVVVVIIITTFKSHSTLHIKSAIVPASLNDYINNHWMEAHFN